MSTMKMSSEAAWTRLIVEMLAVLVIVCGLALTLVAFTPDSRGDEVVDDPEPVGTFTAAEHKQLIRQSEKANALLYPTVATIVKPAGNGWVIEGFSPSMYSPLGCWADEQDCTDDGDEGCTDAGHGECEAGTTELSENEDGSSSCTCDCGNSAAVYFAICRSQGIVDEPDPAGVSGGDRHASPVDP